MASYKNGILKGNNGPKSLFKCGYDTSVKNGMLYENVTGVNRFSKLNRIRGRVLDDGENIISPGDRNELVNLSRMLTAQVAFLDTCIETLADWATGNAWDFFYLPTKETPTGWEKEVESWVNYDLYKNCSVRGFPWTFKNLIHLWITEALRDGDFANNFVINDGMPQVQMIKSHRIYSNHLTVPDGMPFAGSPVKDGIIENAYGKQLGLIIPVNGKDLVVPTWHGGGKAMLCLPIKYYDKGRGLPQLCSALNEAANVQEIIDNLLAKGKMQAALAIIKAVRGGEPDPSDINNFNFQEGDINPDHANRPPPLAFEPMNRGTVEYIEPEAGEEIRELKSNSPNTELQDFLTDEKTEICARMGTPHQIIYSPDKMSTGPTRAVVNFFRNSVRNWQDFAEKYATPFIAWSISVAMEQGKISKNEKEEWWKRIRFTRPGEFPFDRNESRLDLEQIRGGTMSRNAMTLKDGKSFEQTLEELDRENLQIYAKAKVYSAKTGVDIITALNFYGASAGAPNPISPAVSTQTPPKETPPKGNNE